MILISPIVILALQQLHLPNDVIECECEIDNEVVVDPNVVVFLLLLLKLANEFLSSVADIPRNASAVAVASRRVVVKFGLLHVRNQSLFKVLAILEIFEEILEHLALGSVDVAWGHCQVDHVIHKSHDWVDRNAFEDLLAGPCQIMKSLVPGKVDDLKI